MEIDKFLKYRYVIDRTLSLCEPSVSHEAVFDASRMPPFCLALLFHINISTSTVYMMKFIKYIVVKIYRDDPAFLYLSFSTPFPADPHDFVEYFAQTQRASAR